jgi:hypothetical protein
MLAVLDMVDILAGLDAAADPVVPPELDTVADLGGIADLVMTAVLVMTVDQGVASFSQGTKSCAARGC